MGHDAYLFMKLHHRRTLQSTIPTKIWEVLQTRHATVENKLVMSKQVIFINKRTKILPYYKRKRV